MEKRMLALRDAYRPSLQLAAVTLAAATVIAGCGAATPRATGTGLAAVARAPRARAVTPPVFAATLDPRHGENSRVGLFSSATGRLLRWLDRPPRTVSDVVLGVRAGWVYFTQWRAGAPPDVARVPLTGGRARLVRAGTADYALSPDGRMAGYVATVPRGHRKNTEIVVTNLATGHRRTIVMVTGQPVAGTQIGVTNLAWSPDDTHLAVEVVYSAFSSEVKVLDARTARTVTDGRTAPCPGACAAKFPAYLSTGALTYLADGLGGSGPATIALVSWAGDHRAKRLVTIRTGGASPLFYGESTTPRGAAIWALEKQTGAGYVIERWSAGHPVQLRTPPPHGFTGLFGIAW
jgi:hypothetical protein